DLLVAHAVIDLLPVPACLPPLLSALRPDGAAWLSLNYAGETGFRPPHPGDGAIVEAYHADMDGRFPGLDWQPSRTGLLLGPWLAARGHRVIAEGASDWTLEARDPDSALFIGNILDTIGMALAGRPGL